jgi:flagellar basal-body rod protein FlgF
MSADIYASLSGATAAQYQMDLIAQNVANANTNGYKELRVAFELEGSGYGPLGQVMAGESETSPNMANGAIRIDKDPNHLALQGEGFFVVSGGGKEMLTRAGAFQRNEDGNLVTTSGHLLMGESGPIEIPIEEEFRVVNDGTVFGSESGELGQIQIVNVTDVKPVGSSLWQALSPMEESEATVMQGALEGSNVNPLRAMVELIEASRMFEAYQKAMQSSDELDQKLIQMGG